MRAIAWGPLVVLGLLWAGQPCLAQEADKGAAPQTLTGPGGTDHRDEKTADAKSTSHEGSGEATKPAAESRKDAGKKDDLGRVGTLSPGEERRAARARERAAAAGRRAHPASIEKEHAVAARPDKPAETKTDHAAEAKPDKAVEPKLDRAAESKPEKVEAKPDRAAEAKPEKPVDTKPDRVGETKTEHPVETSHAVEGPPKPEVKETEAKEATPPRPTATARVNRPARTHARVADTPDRSSRTRHWEHRRYADRPDRRERRQRWADAPSYRRADTSPYRRRGLDDADRAPRVGDVIPDDVPLQRLPPGYGPRRIYGDAMVMPARPWRFMPDARPEPPPYPGESD